MFDGNIIDELPAIIAAILVGLGLLWWLFFRRTPDVHPVPHGHGNGEPIGFQPRPVPGPDFKGEVQTLRGQLDAEVLARLAVEQKLKAAEDKLKAGSGASDAAQANLDALTRANNELTAQNSDLRKRLDTQQQDQMRLTARFNEEIAALKQQAGQAPAPGALDALRAEVENYKKAANDLSVQNNDMRRSLDTQQEEQMRVVAKFNEEIAGLKQQAGQAPAPGALEALRAEAENYKKAANDLNVQNNDLRRTLDTQQEEQMRAVAKLGDEITVLKNDLARHQSDASRAATLQNDLAAVTRRASELDAEIARLKGLAANATPDLSGDVARLNELVAGLRRERDEARTAERALEDRVRIAEHDLSQARNGMEELGRLASQRSEEIQRLTAKLASMPNVDDYRRFKEALEVANRIASGEKI